MSDLIQLPRIYEKALNPTFVAEIAAGWEDELVVAQRFGFSEPEWEQIKVYKPFLGAVSRARSEMEKDGSMAQAKARVMALDLMDECYKYAVHSETKLADKLEALKTLSKLADMEPKARTAGGGGPSFSITINLPDSSAPITLNAEAVTDVTEAAEDEDNRE
jgi:hypothetical protein